MEPTPSAPLPVLPSLAPVLPATQEPIVPQPILTGTAPTPTYTATTTTAPTGTPAPKCGSAGPTAAQLITVVEGTPGIPDKKLKVVDGPYCASGWHFSEMQLVDTSAGHEPLFVVTKGDPKALKLVEAGTDVCSTQVQTDAPAGITVHACGS
jgi:hypothetical protein